MSYTANFADIYALITVILYDDELHRYVGLSRVIIFEYDPSYHCRPQHDVSQSLS